MELSQACLEYQIIGDDFQELDEIFTITVVAENRFDIIEGPSDISVTIENDQDCESYITSIVECN